MGLGPVGRALAAARAEAEGRGGSGAAGVVGHGGPRDRSTAVPGWYHPRAMAAATVEEAFAYCEARAKAHYENFPVGLFVPRERRPYVHALYAFARAADDFADEPIYEGVRQEKLDQWEALTDAAYRGEAEGPIFVALAETVRRLGIPKELLLDLLSAFRQDTEKTRYASWDELLDYCRRSANPVGRLVLLVFEQKDAALPAALRRDLHRASSSPTTGRTRRSTTRGAASTCPRTSCGATGSPPGTSAPAG